MRLFHNILHRKFKSFPLSYYKRGPSLIEFVNLSSSVSSDLSLHSTSLILPLYNTSTSDLGFNYLKNDLFNPNKSHQSSNLDDIIYNEKNVHFTFNDKTLSSTSYEPLIFSTTTTENSLIDTSKFLNIYSTNNQLTLKSIDKNSLIFDTINSSEVLNNSKLELLIFDTFDFSIGIDNTKRDIVNFDVSSNYTNLYDILIYERNIDKSTISNVLNDILIYERNIDKSNNILSSNDVFPYLVEIDRSTNYTSISIVDKFIPIFDYSRNDIIFEEVNLLGFVPDITSTISNLYNILYESYDDNPQKLLNKSNNKEILSEISNNFNVYKSVSNNNLYQIQNYLVVTDKSLISEKLNQTIYLPYLNEYTNHNISSEEINQSPYLNEYTINDNSLNNINHNLYPNEYVILSGIPTQISNILSSEELVNHSFKITDLNSQLSKYPVFINNSIQNLRYELNKESIDFSIKPSLISNFLLDKETTAEINTLKNLDYYPSKESINHTNHLQLLGHSLSKFVGYISSNLNEVKYEINEFIENIDANININLNHYFSPEINNFTKGISNLEYTLFSNKLNLYQNFDDINHLYTPEIVFSNFNSSKIENINNQIDSTNLISSLSDIINYQSYFYDTVTGSTISFKPFDSSSNLTFNSSSLRHYVRQIHEIFYMSGSQLTSSRIDYQDDIELIVIGKGSTTTYKDNLDYNLPYRASFLVKNWPHYQYNTSSYWYLPVQLNASNDDILSSGDIWVTASFQNGIDVFTDQYGFAIDI